MLSGAFGVCGLSSFAFGLGDFLWAFGCWGVRFGYFMCWCFVVRVVRATGFVGLGMCLVWVWFEVCVFVVGLF